MGYAMLDFNIILDYCLISMAFNPIKVYFLKINFVIF